MASITRKISTGGDDARELDSPVKWYIYQGENFVRSHVYSTEEYYALFRFPDITIPHGSTINSATIKTWAYANNTVSETMTAHRIRGLNIPNPSSFVDTSSTGTSYPSLINSNTSQYGTFPLINWTAGSSYISNDISNVIQELIDDIFNYTPGNALAFFTELVGSYYGYDWQYYSYEGNSAYAAELTIDYTPPVTSSGMLVQQNGRFIKANGKLLKI